MKGVTNIYPLSKVRRSQQQPPELTATFSDVPKILLNRSPSHLLYTLCDSPDSEYNVFKGKTLSSYRYGHGAVWF